MRGSPDLLVTLCAAQTQGVGGDVVVDVDIAQQLARCENNIIIISQSEDSIGAINQSEEDNLHALLISTNLRDGQ